MSSNPSKEQFKREARKAQTEAEQQYKKELARIKRFIKSAEKRGYSFPESAIPKQPKNITPASVNRLRKVTPTTLYKKSEYRIPGTGEVISGEAGRVRKRQEATFKGLQTKGLKPSSISAQKPRKPSIPKTQKRTKTQQKKTTSKPQQSKKQTTKRASQEPQKKTQTKNPRTKRPESGTGKGPSIVDAILQTVEDMLNNWTPDSRWSQQLADLKERDKDLFKSVLNGAINRLGRDVVSKRLEDYNSANPGAIESIINGILYGSGSKYKQSGKTEVQNNVKRFMEILNGTSLTVDEAINLSQEMDAQETFEPLDD